MIYVYVLFYFITDNIALTLNKFKFEH